MTLFPYTTLFRSNEIKKIIEEYKPIEKIIIGITKNINNELSNTGKITMKFAKLLEKEVNINIDFIDEKYTTSNSLEVMKEMNLSNKDKKTKKDAIAAQKILEEYMSRKL